MQACFDYATLRSACLHPCAHLEFLELNHEGWQHPGLVLTCTGDRQPDAGGTSYDNRTR